jgi:hypothetical protein
MARVSPLAFEVSVDIAPRPRSRPVRRGPLAILGALILGLVGSALSIAAGGALVSSDGSLEEAQGRSLPPREDFAAPAPAAPRASPYIPAVCPTTTAKQPPPAPGSREDPFRLWEQAGR